MRKRLHFRNAVYHITTNTQNKKLYFEEEIFCNIFLDNLAYYQKNKSFGLIALKINPDHSHIILQPTGGYNISQIMQSVKRSTSDQINQIIYNLREENPYEMYEWTPRLKLYREQYNRKYNYQPNWETIEFIWQISFDDVFMRDENHLKETITYVKHQQINHNLPYNYFLYINSELPKYIFYPQKKEEIDL